METHLVPYDETVMMTVVILLILHCRGGEGNVEPAINCSKCSIGSKYNIPSGNYCSTLILSSGRVGNVTRAEMEKQ